jgi:acyl-ACP thioesterase
MLVVFGSVVAVSHMQHVSSPAPFPTAGRTFTRRRTIRLGDVTPKGRLRLDAVARYLQDIATDDALDGEYDDPHGWVVRRTEMWVTRFPKYLDQVQLTTWCGGVGSHWAERRTRIEVVGVDTPEAVIEAAALWVRVDLHTLKPLPLTARFRQLIGEAAAGRKVSARLHVGRGLPTDVSSASTFPMPLRFTDFDAVGHLNNAVYWEPLEEYLAGHRDKRAPLQATVEHHASVEPGATPTIVVHELSGRVVLQMRDGDVTKSLIQLVTQ